MKKKSIVSSSILLFALSSQAVHVSPQGRGEVLIYPYYSVNNNLNTLYSVVNTTDQAKALRVRFLEGENADEVLIFSVYLGHYDVWTAALVATTSTLSGHVGESSVSHITADVSCAPFLNKAGQEFLPYEIDLDSPNNDLRRATDGHIEIIEMAVVTNEVNDSADAISHLPSGLPSSCAQIQAAWEIDGYWSLDRTADTSPPSGGLIGNASLINVSEGIQMSYDAIALEQFWQGQGLHNEPGLTEPNLNSGAPQSQVLHQGQLLTAQWLSGAEAVSAVLMQETIYNEYDYERFANGRSEWVATFPTKPFHTNNSNEAIPPFVSLWDGLQACEAFTYEIWDRNEFVTVEDSCNILCPPNFGGVKMCYSANIIEFIDPEETPGSNTKIFGSDNQVVISGSNQSQVTPNGWATLKFRTQASEPVEGTGFKGLPVVGFMAQQYTNANAQAGLLAQYGALFNHSGEVVINAITE